MTQPGCRPPVLLIALLVLGMAACARMPAPPTRERPQVASAAELFQHLQNQAAAVTSLKARGTVAVTSPQKNFSATVLLAAAKPSQVRLDILNFWGQSMVTFLSDGPELQMLVYNERTLYRGPASPENLRRFLPLAVSREDFIAALTGHLAYQLYDQPVMLSSPDPAVYLLELTARSGAEKVRLTVDAQTLSLLGAQWFTPAGEETLKAEFVPGNGRSGAELPAEVYLASGDRLASVRLRYREQNVNAPVPADTWVLSTAGGVREVSFSP